MSANIEALYRRYGPAIHAKCRRMMGTKADADDLTQEVFVRAMGALDRFEGETGHLAWLYRIATNACLSALRKKKHTVSFDEAIAKPAADGVSLPERQVGHASLLERAFGRLADLPQQVVVSYYLDDMTQVEIAEQYGITRRTVFNHLARFRDEITTLREAV